MLIILAHFLFGGIVGSAVLWDNQSNVFGRITGAGMVNILLLTGNR